MYYYLHGLITMHLPNSIVIEVGGVGYEVLVSHPSDYPIGEVMFVYVNYHAYEDEQFFVGFKLLSEKKLYTQLISVKGIGPKTALNCLAKTSLDKLKEAISTSDINYLCKIPGLGKKSASQIVLDLKGKLLESVAVSTDKNVILAKDALKSLGFKDSEINMAFNNIQEDKDMSVEEYIQKALSYIKK